MDRLQRLLDGVSFHRGLALGALVGAAIAGSSLWARLREERDRQATSPREMPEETPKDLQRPKPAA